MCHESVSVGVANQGLGPIGAINGTMGGRWEQLEEDGGRQQKMEHPGVIGSWGENLGYLKTVTPYTLFSTLKYPGHYFFFGQGRGNN